MKDLAVIIGRFQPVHNGHLALLRYAQVYCRKTLILIGSAQEEGIKYSNKSIPYMENKNPFTYQERIMMIQGAILDAGLNLCYYKPIMDVPGDDEKWAKKVAATVFDTVSEEGFRYFDDVSTMLVGLNKDESSFYLNLFPQWEFRNCDASVIPVNACDIRKVWYDSINTGTDFASNLYKDKSLWHNTPKSVIGYLSQKAEELK